ncbi:a disintegrin and metalloproteinase with thrombospondin motifs 20 [Trichonephila clavipes]|nr:a disintegrin and metalloproteinase with thrombospondin motifs 20 [Trichonephila clavipes]
MPLSQRPPRSTDLIPCDFFMWSMSIPHDDDSKCSRFHSQKKKLHVMARMLDYNSHPWSWSECSRQYLTTFFDVGYGRCLMDKPGRNRLLLNDEFHQPPGQLYPRDAQCELVFGPKSRICPYMPECKRLWCTMDGDSTQGGCRTQHMPWADGTQCGESKVEAKSSLSALTSLCAQTAEEKVAAKITLQNAIQIRHKQPLRPKIFYATKRS